MTLLLLELRSDKNSTTVFASRYSHFVPPSRPDLRILNLSILLGKHKGRKVFDEIGEMSQKTGESASGVCLRPNFTARNHLTLPVAT
jgi:hypothetical protein